MKQHDAETSNLTEKCAGKILRNSSCSFFQGDSDPSDERNLVEALKPSFLAEETYRGSNISFMRRSKLHKRKVSLGELSCILSLKKEDKKTSH